MELLLSIPEQTVYEIRSLARMRDGEGSYPTIEEREDAMNRMIYSISQTVFSLLFRKIK